MDKIKNKKGFTLVEAVIALTAIIIVSMATMTIVLHSISARHTEMNKREALNFAENVWECFKAAESRAESEEEFREQFLKFVRFAENAELEEIDSVPGAATAYTYTSKNFIVGITVQYSKTDRSVLGIELLDKKGNEIVELSYEIGRRDDS